MSYFENELDEIRIKLYEETMEMNKEDIIKNVNAHAQKIAFEFGIKVVKGINENHVQPVTA